MNKKIKVIELFNMIANGNIPKMIMRCYEEYKWDESSGEYRRVEDKRRFSDEWVIESILNDEVEILEDEEEIERLDPNKVYFKDGTELVYELMYSKINELVEKVNELEKYKIDKIRPREEK